MTLSEIAAELRKLYPDFTSVTLFVNHQEESVELSKLDSGPDASYRTLSGEWSTAVRASRLDKQSANP